MKIIKNTLKSVFTPLEDAWHKEDDFMEVTEWGNGEGYDVKISESERFSIHFTEWKVLKKLIKALDKQED
jgi:hypothetical protein